MESAADLLADLNACIAESIKLCADGKTQIAGLNAQINVKFERLFQKLQLELQETRDSVKTLEQRIIASKASPQLRSQLPNAPVQGSARIESPLSIKTLSPHLKEMFEMLQASSNKSKQAAMDLFAELKSSDLLRLLCTENDGGVMLEWINTGIYCDIDPLGDFHVSRAVPPDQSGFVKIVTETFESATISAKCLSLLLHC